MSLESNKNTHNCHNMLTLKSVFTLQKATSIKSALLKSFWRQRSVRYTDNAFETYINYLFQIPWEKPNDRRLVIA